jgi:hypothetical protein
MRLSRLWSAFAIVLAVDCSASAQARKPGVYDVTITTTTTAPSGGNYPPRTREVCFTQSMIDKYGAIVPDNLTGPCGLTDVVKKPGGMSAAIACSGGITGQGTLKVDWSDSSHSKGEIHFSGTMHPAGNEIKIEWNATTVSVYKGPDCSVLNKPSVPAPAQVPADPPSQ